LPGRRDKVEIDAASAFNPSGYVKTESSSTAKASCKILKAQLEPYGHSALDTVFSIPSNLATLRWINLPAMPPDELREAAKYKVKRHSPFPSRAPMSKRRP